MATLDFSDAALVILGHGTELNAGSAAPATAHAAELRRRGGFAAVHAAFWKQPPQITAVLAGLVSPRVFIVPLFVSDGYFSANVIPRELGFALTADPRSRIRRNAHQTWHYCHPVGTHDRMTEVILSRAREVVETSPFPRAPRAADVSLFIAGHGTERDEDSRKSIERQVELIRARQLYASVAAVFMEETPRIGDCFSLAQTKNIVVVPFFMSDGLHVTEDIPVLLGEPENTVRQRLAAGQAAWPNPTERRGRRVWYAAAVGSAPLLADVILERVRESAGGLASEAATNQSVA